jgi:hypothetical protein
MPFYSLTSLTPSAGRKLVGQVSHMPLAWIGDIDVMSDTEAFTQI